MKPLGEVGKLQSSIEKEENLDECSENGNDVGALNSEHEDDLGTLSDYELGE